LFSQADLKALWNIAKIALEKMLEVAMSNGELNELIELKRSMFIFCLCMQDQGLTTP
jgi:hypothetical protein